MEHPARVLDEPRKIQYLIAVAALVYADGVIDPSGVKRVADLCGALDLSEDGRKALIDMVAEPDPARLDPILDWIRQDVGLRFSLITDAIVVAFADGRLAGPEADEICEFARHVEVTPEQATLLARYVESLMHAKSDKTDPGVRVLSDQLAAALVHPPKRTWIRGLIRRLRE